ncbi:MAG TPA: hypothetical protein VM367_02030 [Pseudonocardia sp.]|nr:hypothetical protein [Pseudonocardia sp.]
MQAVLADRLRRAFLEAFLASAGKADAARLLPVMIDYRLAHPTRGANVRAAERLALLDLARRHRPRPTASRPAPGGAVAVTTAAEVARAA